MTLILTKDILRASYALLVVTPPFIKWNLPDPEDVQFNVTRGKWYYGDWNRKRGKPHCIRVSSGGNGQLTTLNETMAHEMIHLHIHQANIRDTSDHGKVFRRYAAQVCKVHTCFDPKRF